MGQKWGSNEDIHIGDIFECFYVPYWCNQSDIDCYFQVVALRGRTQVVLRPLRTEKYINERIEEGSPLHWFRERRRPLPGQFMTANELCPTFRYERGKEILRTGEEVTAWVLPDRTAAENRLCLQEVRWKVTYVLAQPEDWEWDEDTIKEVEEEFFPWWRSSLTDGSRKR